MIHLQSIKEFPVDHIHFLSSSLRPVHSCRLQVMTFTLFFLSAVSEQGFRRGSKTNFQGVYTLPFVHNDFRIFSLSWSRVLNETLKMYVLSESLEYVKFSSLFVKAKSDSLSTSL